MCTSITEVLNHLAREVFHQTGPKSRIVATIQVSPKVLKLVNLSFNPKPKAAYAIGFFDDPNVSIATHVFRKSGSSVRMMKSLMDVRPHDSTCIISFFVNSKTKKPHFFLNNWQGIFVSLQRNGFYFNVQSWHSLLSGADDVTSCGCVISCYRKTVSNLETHWWLKITTNHIDILHCVICTDVWRFLDLFSFVYFSIKIKVVSLEMVCNRFNSTSWTIIYKILAWDNKTRFEFQFCQF